MRAITQDTGGAADVPELLDIARHDIAGDEVLVLVHAADVDREIWHLMVGLPYLGRLGIRAPSSQHAGAGMDLAGMDLAGVVEGIGEDVTRFRPGDEVFGIGKGGNSSLARDSGAHDRWDSRHRRQRRWRPLVRRRRPSAPCILAVTLTRQKLGTFINRENHAVMLVLKQLIVAGYLSPAIDRTYPLDAAQEAFTTWRRNASAARSSSPSIDRATRDAPDRTDQDGARRPACRVGRRLRHRTSTARSTGEHDGQPHPATPPENGSEG